MFSSAEEAIAFTKEQDVKFVDVRFCDLPGVMQHFNVPAATCGKICVAEVEEIVPLGSLDPDIIHLPGIYVHRIVQGPHEKRIEQRTVRKKEAI